MDMADGNRSKGHRLRLAAGWETNLWVKLKPMLAVSWGPYQRRFLKSKSTWKHFCKSSLMKTKKNSMSTSQVWRSGKITSCCPKDRSSTLREFNYCKGLKTWSENTEKTQWKTCKFQTEGKSTGMVCSTLFLWDYSSVKDLPFGGPKRTTLTCYSVFISMVTLTMLLSDQPNNTGFGN